ncbi:MAG: PD40 domain-containing protein [Armatimonadetes bacterium]|nr:PD40 domain-containing protein [Armatimonadota bacterium]
MKHRAVIIVGFVALALSFGCGGGSGVPKGRVELEIDWPTRGRYVPNYANSIVATLTVSQTEQHTLTINRIGDPGYTASAQFTANIPVGSHNLDVTAYTQADGQGEAVAAAILAVGVISNQTTVINISAFLQTTIDHLVIEGQPLSVEVGEQQQLQGHAEDASNNVLLIPPGALTWSVVSGGQFGSITPDGLFSGLSAGTATVRLAETGAGVQEDADVVVIQPLPFIAFERDNDIYKMKDDGSGVMPLIADPNNPDSDPAWRPDGSKIAFVSNHGPGEHIYVADANGSNITQLTFIGSVNVEPAWNPDGTRLAFASTRTGTYKIFIMDADGSNVTQVTTGSQDDRHPSWSPNGSRIAFERWVGGANEIFLMDADGSNIVPLTSLGAITANPAWSPSGSLIAFDSNINTAPYDQIFSINSDGTGLTQLTSTPNSSNIQPAFNSTGTRIAFSSGRDGVHQIYVMDADGTNQTRLGTSQDNEYDPTYGPDP